MGIGGSGKQEVTIVLKFQAQVDCDDIDQDKVLGWETAVVELGMLDTKSLNPQNADPHPVVILKKSLSLSLTDSYLLQKLIKIVGYYVDNTLPNIQMEKISYKIRTQVMWTG